MRPVSCLVGGCSLEEECECRAAEEVGLLGVEWEHAWFVEGPRFLALGLNDLDPVSVWPDEIGDADMTQTTGSRQPTYDVTSYNGFPGIVPDGVDDFLKSPVVVGNIAIPQPFSMVMIWRQSVGGGNNIMATWGSSGGSIKGMSYTGSGFLRMNAGTLLGGPSPGGPTAYKLIRSYFNGASSEMFVDEVSIKTGDAGSTGIASVDRFSAFARISGASCSTGEGHFLAYYQGDVSLDPGYQTTIDYAATVN